MVVHKDITKTINENLFLSFLRLFTAIFFIRLLLNILIVNKLKNVYDNKYKNRNHHFVVIGGKNKDFELAVNSHSLFIVPTWLPLEDRTEIYGIHVDTVKQLYKFILTLNNQNTWYSELEVDNITTCVSLMDARFGAYAKDYKEKDMIKNFQYLLKSGTSRNYYQILLYHFLAGMTNTDFFDDIELFGMIPSSDCTLNPDIFEFMTQVRLLKKKKLPRNYMYSEDCTPE